MSLMSFETTRYSVFFWHWYFFRGKFVKILGVSPKLEQFEVCPDVFLPLASAVFWWHSGILGWSPKFFPHWKTPKKYQKISDIIRQSYDHDFNGRKNIGDFSDILNLDRQKHDQDRREKYQRKLRNILILANKT